MASVFDVAAYILTKLPPMTTMKMQKLLYYCQAWSLVWDDVPLFDSRFEAWANGPVAPDYFAEHKGHYTVSSEPKGDANRLDNTKRETVDAVLSAYGDKTPSWLSDLTHQEAPWLTARAGIPSGDRSTREITRASMRDYYGAL